MANRKVRKVIRFLDDQKRIARKERIIKEVYRDHAWFDECFKGREHILSKRKIQCSCPMCTFNGLTRQDVRTMSRIASNVEELECVTHVKHGNRDRAVKNRF